MVISDDIVRSGLAKRGNQDLVAIATGLAEGYTPQARLIAEKLLAQRGAQLPPGARVLRDHLTTSRELEERLATEAGRAENNASSKALASFCLIVGAGSFILPLVGFQFRIITIFGPATPVIGAVLVIAGVLILLGARQSSNAH
jgi:hypothetical protein